MRLARAGAADEHGVELVGDEGPGGEVAHEGLIDGRVGKVEIVDVLGLRQLGDDELVLDGARRFDFLISIPCVSTITAVALIIDMPELGIFEND